MGKLIHAFKRYVWKHDWYMFLFDAGAFVSAYAGLALVEHGHTVLGMMIGMGGILVLALSIPIVDGWAPWSE